MSMLLSDAVPLTTIVWRNITQVKMNSKNTLEIKLKFSKSTRYVRVSLQAASRTSDQETSHQPLNETTHFMLSSKQDLSSMDNK